jgi:hypothetical protein
MKTILILQCIAIVLTLAYLARKGATYPQSDNLYPTTRERRIMIAATYYSFAMFSFGFGGTLSLFLLLNWVLPSVETTTMYFAIGFNLISISFGIISFICTRKKFKGILFFNQFLNTHKRFEVLPDMSTNSSKTK